MDLRWDIAAAAVENADFPSGLSDSAHRLREVLMAAVGPAEQDALRATFEPVRLPTE